MTIKKLVLETTETGCIVPTSHALNHDGYFRKRVNGKLVMYHRHMWEQEVSHIPTDCEVDHKCKNRACCNTNHLQLLTQTEHRSKDNAERYSKREKEAKYYWMETSCTGTKLSEVFGVSISTSCRWIRSWS